MSSDSSTVSPTPPGPYRNPQIGDTIIRTSDQAELHIYGVIVAAASPIFAEMLSLPQPAAKPPGCKPTVDVSESSAVWDILVPLCYAPGHRSAVDDLDDLASVRAVLDAGVKYEMTVAMEWARHVLLLPGFAKERPFGVYALGCKYKLSDVARVAARNTLRCSIYLDYTEELELPPFRAFHRLLEYRKACGAAASGLLTSSINRDRYSRSKELGYLRDETCISRESRCPSVTNPFSGRSSRPAFVDYLKALHDRFEYLPDPDLACSGPLFETAIGSSSGCSSCALSISRELPKISQALRADLERVIKEVVLELEE
ncbi:hypothetical protein BD414DRAFT_540302 [Trametes punicea]|nr:hypothetical protein BD414DRAFT_540302 [Trametes punicea]